MPGPCRRRKGPFAGWRRQPALVALILAVILAVVGGVTGAVFYGLYNAQQAAAVQRKLDRRQAIDALWLKGQQAEAAKNLSAAKDAWIQAWAALDADADAAPGDFRRRSSRASPG